MSKKTSRGQDKDSEKERINKILSLLDEHYGKQGRIWLEHEDAWQLLVATILSAQCTDARVNIVTKELFEKYPSMEAFASADIGELENDIRAVGFYHNKAKNIILTAKKLLSEYNGQVPSDIDSLTSLAGVGRKTANVIRGNIYNIPSIVVDTHVGRISRKLGLTDSTDPKKAEMDLEGCLPRDHWISWNRQLIDHGRSICKARCPKCKDCFLREYCPGRED